MLCSSIATRPSKAITVPPAIDKLIALPLIGPVAVLLVVHDHSLDASCRNTLSNAGFEFVVSVSNNAQALELLGTGNLFDVVVIGIGPGDVDGVTFAQHVRRHRSDTPTVVMSPVRNLRVSGLIQSDDLNQGNRETIDLQVVRETIRKAVGRRHAARVQAMQ